MKIGLARSPRDRAPHRLDSNSTAPQALPKTDLSVNDIKAPSCKVLILLVLFGAQGRN